MLTGARILICEDEPFIALDLALSVEDAGGEVVGPASSVQEAMALIKDCSITGAILDVHLVDRDVTPVAEALLERGVPIVVQSGVGLPHCLSDRCAAAHVFFKPVQPEHLIKHLAGRLLESAKLSIYKSEM